KGSNAARRTHTNTAVNPRRIHFPGLTAAPPAVPFLHGKPACRHTYPVRKLTGTHTRPVSLRAAAHRTLSRGDRGVAETGEPCRPVLPHAGLGSLFYPLSVPSAPRASAAAHREAAPNRP